MTKEHKGEELRRFKRYNIEHCTIQYKPVRFLGLLGKESKKHFIMDISEGGVQFITREDFKLGSRVLLNISAPFLKGEIIKAEGLVRWVRKSQELHVSSIGIEFTVIEKGDHEKLKSLLTSVDMNKIKVATQQNNPPQS